MARGSATPAVVPLPEVKFEKVKDDFIHMSTGAHEQQMRTYGFNDSSDFKRPDQYIRHIEPLESELAVQVEYDMDEQDQEWLNAVNAERKNSQADMVSYEIFEIIMDRLEKEWFDLTKNIPKPEYALPSEDSTCSICDDSEGENSNAIVFCDGCNLAVHQDCYGVPYIPEGQWLCRKCTVSPEVPVVSGLAVVFSLNELTTQEFSVVHILPQRGRSFQADCVRRLGTPSLCYMDTRNSSRQRYLHGAHHGRGKDIETAVEAEMLHMRHSSWSLHPMFQDLLLRGIPCNLRSKREASTTYEECPWRRGSYLFDVLL
jgi:hypothetical protein